MQGGVWVVGTMRGSASVAAGVQQGDELLEIDAQPVHSSTPFQASLQVQGGEGQVQPPPPAKLKVRPCCKQMRMLSLKIAILELYPACVRCQTAHFRPICMSRDQVARAQLNAVCWRVLRMDRAWYLSQQPSPGMV